MTQAELKALLDYDPETGTFWWKAKPKWSHIDISQPAGSLGSRGYRKIKINCREYSEHRLAFLWMTGRFPYCEIDHINLVRHDNRWSNLREATKSQNKANSTVAARCKLGVKGVVKYGNKYLASITKDGRCRLIGSYKTVAEAHAAYCAEAVKQHGEFARFQ